MSTVYCSIPPRINRTALGGDIGLEYQIACIDSWKSAGFDIVSLNSENEIKNLNWIQNVEIIPVNGSRPKICDFFEAMKTATNKSVGIANLDCFFLGSKQLAKAITNADTSGLILAERHNVSSATLAPTGMSCYGFDAFFFNTSILENLDWDRQFHIGETWWDYWFPMAALRGGVALKRLKDPALLHLDHTLNWDSEQYYRNGRRIMSMFCDTSAAGDQIISDDDIGTYAMNTFDYIRNSSDLLSISYLSLKDRILHLYLSGADGMAKDFVSAAQQLTEELSDTQDSLAKTRDMLATEKLLQTRLVGIHSKRLGELLCSIARICHPIGKYLPLEKALEQIHMAGDNMQLRFRVKSGLNL